MPTATKRPSQAVPPHVAGDYNAIFYRLSRFIIEINQLKGGTKHHPDMLSDDKPVVAIASDAIALAEALAVALDTAFPIREA